MLDPDRHLGCLLGLATGDALGTTLEFRSPGTFEPIEDMVGGGPFDLEPGQWTDDTSMALCSAESLLACDGFDPVDQLERFVRWWREGHWSSTGECFDIGNTVRAALSRFRETGDPYPGPTDEYSAGNGSLMRLAPVPMFFASEPLRAIETSARASRITHGAPQAVDACRYFAGLLVGAFQGRPKDELLSPRFSPVEGLFQEDSLDPRVDEVAAGSFLRKARPEIEGTGYVVRTLEAALWAFARTGTFEDGALEVVNRGDDADTTGAVYGQIAGAFYGASEIPGRWRDRLARRDEIVELAEELWRRSRPQRAPAVATRSRTTLLFSESVTEGHPDKVADYISDAVLDAHLAEDPYSRVACETLVKEGTVVLAGEITSHAEMDLEAVVREAVREVGYGDPGRPFAAGTLRVCRLLTEQSREITEAVVGGEGKEKEDGELGAGDQGFMYGYATSETPELYPLPPLLAHRVTRLAARDRKEGEPAWLLPDGKCQVAVEYADGGPRRVREVLVSLQHEAESGVEEVEAYVRDTLLPRALQDWWTEDVNVLVNPAGTFHRGGPSADCGLTGRKIIVDTYGGIVRHGGGAFSGKDPTKVDRSGAYFARFVARALVSQGIAERAEVRVAYRIGVAEPVGVDVDVFGTGDEEEAAAFARSFDFRPGAIIRHLGLREPLYRRTTNYGHFGRPGLPWEAD